MPTSSERGFSTRALHASIPWLLPLTHIMPPFLTSTYAMESLEDEPSDDEFSFKYPRIAHPNGVLLEYTLASLEEGEAAAVMTDGMRAISATIDALVDPNSEGTVISTRPLYADTYSVLEKDLPVWRKKCFFLDAQESPEQQFLSYIICSEKKEIPKIELLLIETPANPTLAIFDIARLAHIAHAYNILVVVDNTFASPYNQRPLLLGADVVVHSLTKYCCGNGTTLGGAAIGKKHLIKKIKQRIKRRGGHLTPFSSWLIQLGLQTFAARMRLHNKNALLLAKFLSSEENKQTIARVHYPGLASHPGYDIAKRQMRTPSHTPGFGGMISFELNKPEWVKPFAESLANNSFIELAVSLGSTSSTFAVPARQIHTGLSLSERQSLGINKTLIRLSVGIEDYRDIKKAVQGALAQLL